MAVTIRLARHGRRLAPFYRIVAADKAMRRDGRYLELLGTVNPAHDPITVNLKEERVKYWISVGAYPSDTVKSIIDGKLPGYLDEVYKKRLDKIQARRKARKARAGKVVKAEKSAKATKKAAKSKKAPAAKKAKSKS